jgi:steroid 5-alpha reductase family enzyme
MDFLTAIQSLKPIFITSMGMQAAGFLIAAPLQTEKFYDILGSATYIACLGVSIFRNREFSLKLLHSRQILVSCTTLIWCLRLGMYLGYRMKRDKEDRRFMKIKKNPVSFGAAWFMQGLWVIFTALPVFVVNSASSFNLADLGWIDYIGLSLWVVGFLFESISDWQKLNWQSKLTVEERKARYIDEGLWSISQHPNYFGEIMLWIGNFLVCSSAYRNAGIDGFPVIALFALSPSFISFLLLKISGVPLLTKLNDKRFAGNDGYKEYKARVPLVIPKFFASKSKTD